MNGTMIMLRFEHEQQRFRLAELGVSSQLWLNELNLAISVSADCVVVEQADDEFFDILFEYQGHIYDLQVFPDGVIDSIEYNK